MKTAQKDVKSHNWHRGRGLPVSSAPPNSFLGILLQAAPLLQTTGGAVELPAGPKVLLSWEFLWGLGKVGIR